MPTALKQAAALPSRFLSVTQPYIAEIAKTPAYWIISAIFLAYAITAIILLHAHGIAVSFTAYYEAARLPVSIAVLVLLLLGWPPAMRAQLARVFRPELIVSGLLLLLMAEIFHSIFLTFKMSFTSFKPFNADNMMAGLGHTMHFGRMPWEWLWPVFGNRFSIVFIDRCYTLWLAVDALFLLWMAFCTKKPDVRAAFFLTYFMTWIVLGTVFALAYLSAGPCYFHLVSHAPNPYQAQMDALRSIDAQSHLYALEFQKTLWSNKINSAQSLVNGISAFPSTHVAVALIFFLAALQYGRIAAAMSGVFFLIILIGSVLLGWHYAVDGYFSIIVTLPIWYSSLWLVRRFNLWKPLIGKADSPR